MSTDTDTFYSDDVMKSTLSVLDTSFSSVVAQLFSIRAATVN